MSLKFLFLFLLLNKINLPDIIQSAKSNTITATAATVHLLLGCNITLIPHQTKSQKLNTFFSYSNHPKTKKKSHAAQTKNRTKTSRIRVFLSRSRTSSSQEVLPETGSQPVHLLQERKKEPITAAAVSSRKLRPTRAG